MYIDEIVNELVKKKDSNGLKKLYNDGKITHSELKRALKRSAETRLLNVGAKEYQETYSRINNFYLLAIGFTFFDILLTIITRESVIMNNNYIILIVFIILVYIPYFVYLMYLAHKKYDMLNITCPTPAIRKNTKHVVILLYLQLIPFIGVIFDIGLLYKLLTTKSTLAHYHQLDTDLHETY